MILDASGNTAHYMYDAQGTRVRKVVLKGNIKETRFYLGDYEYFEKTVSGVADITRETLKIQDDKQVVAIYEIDNLKSETIRYQITNHLGSSALELDENAQIISYEEYHPFGTTSYRSGNSEVEVSLKRYKYCFKELDTESGLYFYGARYYAAWLGRFISVDPKSQEFPWQSSFCYAANNPVKFIEVNGESAEKPDDFFDKKGKLIKRTPVGNAVHVINSSLEVFNAVHNNALKQNTDKNGHVYWNAVNSSSSYYTTNIRDLKVDIENPTKGNAQILRSIIYSYFVEVFPSKDFPALGLIEMKDHAAIGEAVTPNNMYFAIDGTDRKLPDVMQNSHDIKSLIIHEQQHLEVVNPNDNMIRHGSDASREMDSYFAEVSNDNFRGVSDAFRKHTIGNIEHYMNQLSSKEREYWKPQFEEKMNGTFTEKKGKYVFTKNK